MSKLVQSQDSRRTFIDVLIKLAEQDERIVLITPDVGFLYLEEFEKRFPNRYFNLGVTEQSIVMIATGMAVAGLKPYVYSMINFVLFRPGEMVRNGLIGHNADVKLLGVKGSSSYKFLGFSHNLLHDQEDTNFCDNIGLKWYKPQDNHQVISALEESYASNKAAYTRLS